MRNKYKNDSTWPQIFLELSQLIDQQIGKTCRHSDRVAHWAVATARQFNPNQRWIDSICWGGLLHDIGKISVPRPILNKKGALTKEEWVLMKMHPSTGANIVCFTSRLAFIAPFIYYHQERYDGSGYPEGLRGEDIPLESRILSVADAYDAMTSDRFYRKAPGHDYAVNELRTKSGEQFDPHVVDTFLKIITNGY
jgi:HD-GYP domain-containing protein (c-di-GMP phosphodiesterase class II)